MRPLQVEKNGNKWKPKKGKGILMNQKYLEKRLAAAAGRKKRDKLEGIKRGRIRKNIQERHNVSPLLGGSRKSPLVGGTCGFHKSIFSFFCGCVKIVWFCVCVLCFVEIFPKFSTCGHRMSNFPFNLVRWKLLFLRFPTFFFHSFALQPLQVGETLTCASTVANRKIADLRPPQVE